MSKTGRCPRCGKRLSDAVLDGTCPTCLFAAGAGESGPSSELSLTADDLAIADLPPPTEPSDGTNHSSIDLQLSPLPSQIGPYRLIEPVGEGGMGVVYRAEQQHPVRRVVAIKLVKPGMDSRQVLARFESERQTLAMMAHPHVARVFDAGVSGQGRPYFVMEFVAGEPITTFCDRHCYSIRRRLELFVQACEAVQHAHQKAVIHRDLKPSNILVTLQESGKPCVKIIDFGVAKAIAQPPIGQALYTEHGQLIGTPEYMSPEQAEMSSLDIDTRTDIYSLGAVLYELLSGTVPFDPKTLREAPYAQVQRIIRDVDPPRPSTRVSGFTREQASEIARHRQTPLANLVRELRNELEWIPLKALRKDRAERYTTAVELAQDVQNYLEHRPLLAGPESAAYRVRKFVRRNRGPVIAVAAVLAVTIAGGTMSAWQAIRLHVQQQRTLAEMQRAERQKEAAQEAFQFLLEGLLDTRGRAGDTLVVLDRAAQGLATGLKGQPLVRAAICRWLGEGYQSLGLPDRAIAHLQEAVSLRRQQLGDQDAETIRAMNSLTAALRSAGQTDQALNLAIECVELSRHHLGGDNPDTVRAIQNLAWAHFEAGRPDLAERLSSEALETCRRMGGEDDPETLSALNDWGCLLRAIGKFAQAEQVFRTVVQKNKTQAGPNDPRTITAIHNLAAVLHELGRDMDAAALLEEALECSLRAQPEHLETFDIQYDLAVLRTRQHRSAEAERLLRDALIGYENHFAGDDLPILNARYRLAWVVRDRSREEAAALMRQVLEVLQRPDPFGSSGRGKLRDELRQQVEAALNEMGQTTRPAGPE